MNPIYYSAFFKKKYHQKFTLLKKINLYIFKGELIMDYQKFESFWKQSLEELNDIPYTFDVYKETSDEAINNIGYFSYRGAKHEKIYGFYLKHDQTKRPTILMFHGYQWHKGEPKDYLDWYRLGLNVFAIDIRGQKGQTKDQFKYPNGDHRLMTRGLGYPHVYYLKHVVQDGLQLMNLVKTLPFVDQHRLILHGASQGGGLVFMLASLMKVSFVYADVPSYSHFEGRMEDKTGSVKEIAQYVSEHHLDKKTILNSLRYFDLMQFAPYLRTPLMSSVGLKDDICPAKDYMFAYNTITAPKMIYEYPMGGHEGGASVHHAIKLKHLQTWLLEN